jgi:hypothetical protein
MATIIVIIISGNGFIEITSLLRRKCFVEQEREDSGNIQAT